MRHNRLPMLTMVFTLAFFYAPMLVMAVYSFNDSRFGGGAWQGFTLRYYTEIFRNRDIWAACSNTLLIAAAATVAATVLGTTAAFALHRYRSRVQVAHRGLIYTPLVIPDILMGISLMLFFLATGMQKGLFTVWIAHVTFCISYVALVVLARLQDFDPTLIEAARDLGCDAFTAARKVLLPLLMPGIVAGGLLAFTLSLDDYVVTAFAKGEGANTLPVFIYSTIKRGRVTMVNSLSTIMLVLTFVAVMITQRLVQPRGAPAGK